MRLVIIFIITGLISCKKHDLPNYCSEIGTIKKGSTLGLSCPDALFIVRSDNKIVEPVITHDLLNGFSEGDVIRFGHKEIFLGMRSCGENIETAELLCVDTFKPNK
ncbi:hypothetical protein FRZ67_10895 [Panacibacter ginsenosidivorans]|uniref:Uncharacterized protein n=1 Tax=Panacibacter ginsenosidivorans TaxID=1813871 RepID=A0A5B8V8G3_9BACT|nr:hypothetical protein [Panacibacter ginsenosidivorans]QEC67777.1 hypothetical protein FRZ67_10895 [Panacibacter ginsenosidivorans]